jgi:hypothetical protein
MLWDRNGNLRHALSADIDASAWNVFRPGSEAALFSITDSGQGTAFAVRDKANHVGPS